MDIDSNNAGLMQELMFHSQLCCNQDFKHVQMVRCKHHVLFPFALSGSRSTTSSSRQQPMLCMLQALQGLLHPQRPVRL